MTIPWLTILALLPAAGAVLLIFTGVKVAKQVALASLITFAFALVVATQFTPGGGMQLVEQAPWIKPLGAYYALGLDGLGLTLVLLVVIITPVVIIAFGAISTRLMSRSADRLPLILRRRARQRSLRSMTRGCSSPWCWRSRAVPCISSWQPMSSCSTCSSRSSWCRCTS